MRLIDADALLEELNNLEPRCANKYVKQGIDDGLHYYMPKILEEQPTIDAVPVVHGRWEIKTDDYDCEYAKCSACGEEFYDANEDTIDITFNYCPNCGARMDAE